MSTKRFTFVYILRYMCHRAPIQTKQGRGWRVGACECQRGTGGQLFWAEDTRAHTGVTEEPYGVWRKSGPGGGQGLTGARRAEMSLAVGRIPRRWIGTERHEEVLSSEGLCLSRRVSWEPPGAWSRD